MQNSLSLNDLYDSFLAGCLGKKKFEADIFRIIRKDVYRHGLPGLTDGDHDDFLSWLSFRLGRAISGYRTTGSTFETYINVTVRLAAKEYRSLQIRDYAEETAAWMTQLPDMYAYEREPDYDEPAAAAEKTDETGKFKNPRQILILLLKCSHAVSAELLEKIAPRLDIDHGVLMIMIDHLKRLREKREQELVLLREKANRQFYRCIYFERTLKTIVEDSVTTQRLRKKLEQGRKRLITIRERIAKMRLDPSNQQIAKLLGISKGTVDTVLFTLKSQWNNRENKATLT